MIAKKNSKKIVKYKKYIGINIGTLLFGIVFVYMMVCIVMYLTSTHIAPYEVKKGSLSGNYKYTALALKSETVVEAPESGAVTYYAREGTEIGKNGVICSINENGTTRTERTSASSQTTESASLTESTELSESTTESSAETETTAESTDEKEDALQTTDTSESGTLSAADAKKLCAAAAGYASAFSGQNFQKAYDMKADVESAVLDLYTEDVYGNADEGSLFNVCRMDGPGIVVYSVDGFEDVKAEDVTTDMFSMKAYHKENLRLNGTAKSGDPLYKLVTEDNWSLILPIDNKIVSELTDQSSVTIRFLKDGTTADATVSVVQNKNTYFAKLDMDHSVVRFASDRFLDIELLLNKKSGLKIPKTAIEQRNFYIIPQEYVISNNDDSNEVTVLVETYTNSGKSEQKYKTTTVYEKVDDNYYVDINEFSEGDYIVRKNSSNKYRIEETASLQGVYNINKGYAVFREVTVIAENEEYCIVADDDTFGLAQYDHIALDADTVSDDQLL